MIPDVIYFLCSIASVSYEVIKITALLLWISFLRVLCNRGISLLRIMFVVQQILGIHGNKV